MTVDYPKLKPGRDGNLLHGAHGNRGRQQSQRKGGNRREEQKRCIQGLTKLYSWRTKRTVFRDHISIIESEEEWSLYNLVQSVKESIFKRPRTVLSNSKQDSQGSAINEKSGEVAGEAEKESTPAPIDDHLSDEKSQPQTTQQQDTQEQEPEPIVAEAAVDDSSSNLVKRKPEGNSDSLE